MEPCGGLTDDMRDALLAAPESERSLLELRLAWPALGDQEALIAARLRVFLLTWDPFWWMADRGWAWATATGDGDAFEVVLYVTLHDALRMPLPSARCTAPTAPPRAGRESRSRSDATIPARAEVDASTSVAAAPDPDRPAIPLKRTDPVERTGLPAPPAKLDAKVSATATAHMLAVDCESSVAFKKQKSIARKQKLRAPRFSCLQLARSLEQCGARPGVSRRPEPDWDTRRDALLADLGCSGRLDEKPASSVKQGARPPSFSKPSYDVRCRE